MRADDSINVAAHGSQVITGAARMAVSTKVHGIGDPYDRPFPHAQKISPVEH